MKNMISKKEWENIEGEKLSDIVRKYHADVSCSLSSKAKRAPRGDEAYDEYEDKGDRGYGVYGKDGGEIRFSPKDIGYRNNKDSMNVCLAYLLSPEGVEGIECVSQDVDDVYVYGLDEIKEAYQYVNVDNKV